MSELNMALAKRMEALLRRLADVVADHSPAFDIGTCGMLAKAVELEAWNAACDITGSDEPLDQWDSWFTCPEFDEDGPPIEKAIADCVGPQDGRKLRTITDVREWVAREAQEAI